MRDAPRQAGDRQTIVTERGQALARDIGALAYVETSALLNTGLDDLVDALVRAAVCPESLIKRFVFVFHSLRL